MKKLILVSLSIAFASITFGQGVGNWCGADRVIQKQLESDPAFREILHQSMLRAATSKEQSSGERATIVVPTVIHIIHDNGFGNITDEQILDGMNILNTDYNRLNADTSITRNTAEAPFKPFAASMDIVFKLAKIDPNGECTNGIVRVNAPTLTYNAGEDCKDGSLGGSDQWPRDEYFNIWIVNSIDNDGEPGIILGYAYYPYGGAGGTGYGILIRNDAFGSIETADNSDGRTLTHEMGHALGLAHIFDAPWGEDDACHTSDCFGTGDYCCDTPPQKAPNWSCSQVWNSCPEVPTNDAYGFDAYDQIENYMSYNACQNMFSIDQAGIMNFNFIDIDFLAGLISPSNIVATGVNDPEILCKAEFESYHKDICPGTIVDFNDFSFHNPTSWTWVISPGMEGVDYNFVGGTDGSSQYPSIAFLTSASYDVELTVSDGVTSNTELKAQYIFVNPSPASLPFSDGFEGYSTLASTNNWSVFNDAGEAFEIVENVAHTGARSVRLLNFGEPNGEWDELISAPVDLSVIDPLTGTVTMTFHYSYNRRVPSTDEWLKVYISNDCGRTWVQRKTIHGLQLSPLDVNSPWSPVASSDWNTVHLSNITSAYFVENFRYKFKFESNGGNNFYLDDINIYSGGINSLSDEEFIQGLSLYPNPADNELNVNFKLASNGTAHLQITDLAGKELEKRSLNVTEGENTILLETAKYASGVYLLHIHIGDRLTVKQFIVK
jgi:PKD repeat protein